MLWLKFIHVSKGGHRCQNIPEPKNAQFTDAYMQRQAGMNSLSTGAGANMISAFRVIQYHTYWTAVKFKIVNSVQL